MTIKNTAALVTIILCLIALGLGIGIYTTRQKKAPLPPNVQGMLWPASKKLLPFSMVDHRGESFNLQKLEGQWSFMFFGYTNCPDICPITMTVFKQIYSKLQEGQQHTDVQMIFVSVDPERDTTERLQDYISYFNKEFVGLGGSIEQIQSLSGQLGITFFNEQATVTEDYLVAHNSSIILIDPHGHMVALLSTPHQAEDIFTRFEKIRTFLNKQTNS